MANISNVEGAIVFTTENEKALDAIADVFQSADNYLYNTSFDIEAIEVSTNESGNIVGTVPFFGAGRWSYGTNADRMIEWISEDIDNINEKILNTVTATWFDVTITWREYEVGNSFVANGSVRYHKNAGETFDKTDTTFLGGKRSDLSVPSMNAFGFTAELFADFSPEGIENFINYFEAMNPDELGELNRYSIDQITAAMKGHERDVFYQLEYLSDYDEGIKDYRERILTRIHR